MIKRIANWSFGAFFRTIGRILAYLLIGVLILIIGAKSGFKLFIMPVKASEARNWASTLPAITRAQLYDCTTSNSCTDVGMSSQGLTLDSDDSRLFFAGNKTTLASGGIALQVNVGSVKSGYLYLTNFYLCANKSLGSTTTAEIYTSVYSTPGKSTSTHIATNYMGLSEAPGNGDQEFSFCRQYSGLYVPNEANNWVSLRIKSSSTISNFYPSLIATETKELGIYDEKLKEIIRTSGLATASSVSEVKEATDKIKEETKKTNDTLNDDDTSEADDKISGFFSDFNNNNHGLSAIVTAPLNAVNSMLSNTCVSPSIVFKGKTISFPCGNILWEKDTTGDFNNLLNLFFGGLLCFWIIKSLFKDVNDLKNPDNDRIEVSDL